MKRVKVFTDETFYYEEKWTKRYGHEVVVTVPPYYDIDKLEIHYSEDEENIYGEVEMERELEVNKIPYFIVRRYYGSDMSKYEETLYLTEKFNSEQKFRKEWIKDLEQFMYRNKFLFIPETNVVVICEDGRNMSFVYIETPIANHRELRKWLKKENYIN